jgi:hypothetical protein
MKKVRVRDIFKRLTRSRIMCGSQHQVLVEEVVDEFVGGQKQFTAKDVTDKVKVMAAQAGLLFERHRDLKGTVHNKWADMAAAGYVRTLVDLPGINVSPWLHSPQGADPQEYVDAWVAEHGDAVDADNDDVTVDNDDDDDDVTGDEDEDDVIEPIGARSTNHKPPHGKVFVRSLTTESRLTIPIALTTNLNVTEFALTYANGGLFVSKSGSALPGTYLKTRQPALDGRLRISRSVLRSAGLSGSTFKIHGDSRVITIQAA